MITKKARSSVGGSSETVAVTRSHQPAGKTPPVKRRSSHPREAAEPVYPQAQISDLLAEVKATNDELNARVSRLLKRLS
jgi:hypothetical protein